MATKAEVNAVYAAGLIQGITLVTFPAASTIFTSPSEYGLSNTQYGTMFVPSAKVPLYGLAFSIGNLIGPLTLGPLFDSWGRKQMIAGTYLVSGVLLAWSAVMFDAGVLNATTQTIMWVATFFFASAGASAAYLTVSETWPIEIRAEAIAVFFAIGSIAGALGPAFYGALIGTGTSRAPLFFGYLIGAGIMIIGGLVEIFLGVNAAGKSLEQVTKPITAVSDTTAEPTGPTAA